LNPRRPGVEAKKEKRSDFLDEVSLAAHSYMLLAVIRARIGNPVPEDIRRRIHAERDFTRMEHWAVDLHHVSSTNSARCSIRSKTSCA
jgi:hypothetical protein